MLERIYMVQRIISYIDDHISINPSLATLATLVGYSQYHCSELFHDITGITIREYVAKRRLCTAAQMLCDTDMKIIDIAMECGYSSQQALSRAFKCANGCSPAAYRKDPERMGQWIRKEVEGIMELRKVFDTVSEQFDKYRPKYSEELFNELIAYSKVNREKKVLELGPGTGQATDPVLNTGCEYYGIELGKNLAAKMIEKYDHNENFHLIHDDFITHDFGEQRFDMIYSAATIQWLPENTAFSKTFSLLKPGGVLAMMLIHGDYKTPNVELYERIQKVYADYFKPIVQYKHGNFNYNNAVNYGYCEFERREYYGKREFNADEYISYLGTHCDHIVIPEPYKSRLFDGVKTAILEAGNRIVFHDTCILYLAKKPL
ncbi:MAG: helix-turn-helix domain-containing protein [Oscillospiraceae bacterium]|nr:helix-turn-helix domain-containing protein [Oscillospiraceae bacterium]